MYIIKLIGFLGLATMLASCGSAKTIVIDPIVVEERPRSVKLVASTNTVKVSREQITKFEASINKRLYKELNFFEGDDIIISYKFIQLDEGDRFKRWITAGIGNSGEGSLTVEFIFYAGDRKLGKIQTTGKIGSGFLGGSFDSAVESAADALVEYINTNL